LTWHTRSVELFESGVGTESPADNTDVFPDHRQHRFAPVTAIRK
jgi:hypothetical protein